MKEFYRVMLGRGSMYAQECREQGFIGAGFEFLTKFYLDADLGNFVVKDSRIVCCCSNYNSSDSVPFRRKQRSEEADSPNEITK